MLALVPWSGYPTDPIPSHPCPVLAIFIIKMRKVVEKSSWRVSIPGCGRRLLLMQSTAHQRMLTLRGWIANHGIASDPACGHWAPRTPSNQPNTHNMSPCYPPSILVYIFGWVETLVNPFPLFQYLLFWFCVIFGGRAAKNGHHIVHRWHQKLNP